MRDTPIIPTDVDDSDDLEEEWPLTEAAKAEIRAAVAWHATL